MRFVPAGSTVQPFHLIVAPRRVSFIPPSDSSRSGDQPGELREDGLGTGADVNWRGDLTKASSGSFEKHPLHQSTYPWSLAVLKFCQKLITSAESSINEDGEVQFNSWPSIEGLIDLRKHVMAVSAKLAGGLSSENRDAEEIKVSLEFLGMAYNHLGIAIFLLRNLLLERTKTDQDEKLKWVLNEFLGDATAIETSLRAHMQRLRHRIWNDASPT